MSEREGPFSEGEFRNNNRQQGGALPDGDANANEIQTDTLSGRADTAEQDKVVIWGTDSQCDDPELAEFEMLECQELEAYLVEEDEDFVGLADRRDLRAQPSLCGKAQTDQAGHNKSRGERRSVLTEGESNTCHGSGSRDVSETDGFVSCLSTISSMATARDASNRTQESWHHSSGPYSTISEDLTLHSQTCSTDSDPGKASHRAHHPPLSSPKSTILQTDVNLNSAVDSMDAAARAQLSNGQVPCRDTGEEHKRNNNQRTQAGDVTEHKVSPTAKKSQEGSNTTINKSTQAEAPDGNDAGTKGNQAAPESKAIKKQGSFDATLKKQNSFDKALKKQPSFENSLKKQLSFDNTLKKQASLENAVASGSNSLERRKPWGSPSRPAIAPSPKTTSCSPKRRPPGSPAKVQGVRALSLERSSSPQRAPGQTVKPAGRTLPASGIPKPVTAQQTDPRRTSPPHKPKNVRPKIITYVRKNPQAKPDVPNEAGANPLRLSSYPSPPHHKDPKAGPAPKATVLCSSNLLFDRFRQELQKVGNYPPITAVPGMRPHGSSAPQRLGGKSDSFHEDELVPQEASAVYRSPRTLRPQLGLGAVARQPAAKTRAQQPGQRSAPPQTVRVDPAGEQRSSGPDVPSKSLLVKPGQSGLRPPGFSALPPGRLAAFGFVRSSSASSVSTDSGHSDACPAPQPPHGEVSHGPSRPPPNVPNAPNLQRRTQRSSPLASRREVQKEADTVTPPRSSPRRFAVVPPKPQSPGHGRTAGVHGAAQADRSQEFDRVLIQQLRERCEQQAVQLQSFQAQLKKACLCLDVFSITTQHFCVKTESAAVKERELSLELARIRDEVAFSVAHWEQLQREKEDLERRFQAELLRLRVQQQRELEELEERLRAKHQAETGSLRGQQRRELEELRVTQRQQIEEMCDNHKASLAEMETAHNDTLATLQEEHARTVRNLKMAHEQQRKSLEEEFEKIRLSLQDQVDTLTFQNCSLRDRAKRFEEALRRSTDEQIVDALAPYKHIEEDLKSLKEVLEMKNQQIHQQDLKISELEKIAEKNVYLEERVQILQQQNEDLKERIDKNLAVSRQLSEENANLQVHVEKESNEKKRLSRTNEELLWRLQTGELSPRMSPTSSPIHRPSSGPGSPARPHSYHQ